MVLPSTKADATPSELRLREWRLVFPGFPSKPWAEISQRFQRINCSLHAYCFFRESLEFPLPAL